MMCVYRCVYRRVKWENRKWGVCLFIVAARDLIYLFMIRSATVTAFVNSVGTLQFKGGSKGTPKVAGKMRNWSHSRNKEILTTVAREMILCGS